MTCSPTKTTPDLAFCWVKFWIHFSESSITFSPSLIAWANAEDWANNCWPSCCEKILRPLTPKIPAESGWSYFWWSALIDFNVSATTSSAVSSGSSSLFLLAINPLLTSSISFIFFYCCFSYDSTTLNAFKGSFSTNLAAKSSAYLEFSSCDTWLAMATVASKVFLCYSLARAIDLLIRSSWAFFSFSSSSCFSIC